MDRKNLEQYLGMNVEIMLMPDGHKTSGVLLKCEDDHIALGNELWVYPMIWGVRPIDTPVNINPTATKPEPTSEITHQPKSQAINFQIDLDKYFSQMQADLEAYTLNADYVRKFRVKGPNKIQNIIESILTKYQYAVKAHEDRPYSMRMREILDTAYQLWKNNKTNIAASEIYAFVLYLTGESERSVKLYMRVHDFHGAFMASSSAASKILASTCIAISEPLTPKNFATLLKLDPPLLVALLKWILNNAVLNDNETDEYKEFCFNHVAALSTKVLGFSSWQDNRILFSQENIDALLQWLETQPDDSKIINDALKLVDKSKLPSPEESKPKIDWSAMRFEGEFDFFNPNRDKLYGFIKCPILRKYSVPLRSENSVFVHFNQIQDRDLRRKLLTEKKMKPMIRVTFKLGNNVEGPAAFEVREKQYNLADTLLKVDMPTALSEEGEIDFYRRHEDIPFGKVRTKDGKLYTFNESNIIDPVLAVFLEYSPSAEGHPVRFTKTFLDNNKVQIHNIESATSFPEDKLKAWEEGGLIQKARERMKLESPEENSTQEEITEEIDELINRGYMPLEIYSPDKSNDFQFSEAVSTGNNIPEQKRNGVETFNELPKFLQDKILSVRTAGKVNTEFLGDTLYRRGHYREVKANYLQLISKFNSEDATLTNAERAERCFLIARYVYNFFALADYADIRLYSVSEEENIRVMAYKGLEYLIYEQLDGAKKNESNYDMARRFCLLKIADEIQTARQIDYDNMWLKVYIYSYFVNGLRFHNKSGKWSPQNISLAGSSLLECNDFNKFYDGVLALAYVTEPSLLIKTLRDLLYNPEYAGLLLEKLGLDYSKGNILAQLQDNFQNAVDEYAKRKDIFMQDPEVKLSPEIFRILSVQSAIIRLMKRELATVLKSGAENLDAALKRAIPILDTEEYKNSLDKTRRKYNPDATLLDILPINVLGKIMGQYWPSFALFFNGKSYNMYWKERFEKLQWVRNPVVHAHPEYVKKEDIEQVKAICQEITECLAGKL